MACGTWVGTADEVRVSGSPLLTSPLRKVAPDLHQVVVRYRRAQETRAQLRYAVTRGEGKEVPGFALEEPIRRGELPRPTLPATTTSWGARS